MEAAIFGLAGTVIGGLITILVAHFNTRKDLRLKQLEREAQREGLRDAERAKERERRLDRYAAFLGAYRQVQGGVVDIVLLMQHRPNGWSATVGEIVDSAEYSAAVGRLNEGAAWIALLCREPRAVGLASQLRRQHDALFEELRCARSAIADGGEIDVKAIAAKRNATDATFEELLQCLRAEMLAV